MPAQLIAGIVVVLLAVFGLVGLFWLRRRSRLARRRQLLKAPFPPEYAEILHQQVPLYRHLPEDLREQLRRHLVVFLGEKAFEGCGGLELTDTIRVTIAGHACLLLLNRQVDYYPSLHTILVYPAAYIGRRASLMDDDLEPAEVRLGESWDSGTVVLAWDNVKLGAVNIEDGHNVVLHEFAHQLDQESGAADGAPVLEERSAYKSWAAVLSAEYKDLVERVAGHHRSLLDRYGATNPAEFFAVATETFFEKPRQMQRKHPELYDELKGYYKVDPAEWVTDL